MRKIVANFNVLLFFLMLFLGIGGAQAQENMPEEFTFLKTIDQVDIYFSKIFCGDNVEYLVIGAINNSNASVSLSLQPVFLSDDNSFSSSAPISFTLSVGEQIIGDCNASNLQVSVFEFFTQYDPDLVTFDLTKI